MGGPAKKEAPKPVVDERKEQIKNALFSGIGGATKDSDSDDDKPTQQSQQPVA